MKIEFDLQLCRLYPTIFSDRNGDPAETAMCWGFQCGDGWFGIINDLCAEITRQVNAGAMPPVVAAQVKEKSGHLRFYICDHFNRDANPEAHRLIELAQRRAERTCQHCGSEFEPHHTQPQCSGCPKCADRAYCSVCGPAG